ncbi:hypothetical protein [Galbibacter mesophilus]|uniref:hypothetical protein n=1 Tax=Galbibacter mesophilus TaxID=379069 RepID=UPI00191DC215|nr:hypothetical protein [Galbibacter mesophilus]MCM5664143.1 hypothetical protein [Galbibacter mesophilus]
MKKIYLCVALFCALALFVKCSKEDETTVSNESGAVSGSNYFLSSSDETVQSSQESVEEIERPEKCLTKSEAEALRQNYDNAIQPLYLQQKGIAHAKDFWWTVEDLENYLAFVKQEANQKGYSNLGIRFRLGKYGEGHKNGSVTLFMQPTGVLKSKGSSKSSGDGGQQVMIDDVDGYNDSIFDWPPK